MPSVRPTTGTRSRALGRLRAARWPWAKILGLLKMRTLGRRSRRTSRCWRLLGDARARFFADRPLYRGITAYVPVPEWLGMLDPTYLARNVPICCGRPTPARSDRRALRLLITLNLAMNLPIERPLDLAMCRL